MGLGSWSQELGSGVGVGRLGSGELRLEGVGSGFGLGRLGELGSGGLGLGELIGIRRVGAGKELGSKELE